MAHEPMLVPKAGMIARSRRTRKDPWVYVWITKVEGGICHVRTDGDSPRRAEWIVAEMGWRHQHGLLELKWPKK